MKESPLEIMTARIKELDLALVDAWALADEWKMLGELAQDLTRSSDGLTRAIGFAILRDCELWAIEDQRRATVAAELAAWSEVRARARRRIYPALVFPEGR